MIIEILCTQSYSKLSSPSQEGTIFSRIQGLFLSTQWKYLRLIRVPYKRWIQAPFEYLIINRNQLIN